MARLGEITLTIGGGLLPIARAFGLLKATVDRYEHRFATDEQALLDLAAQLILDAVEEYRRPEP